MFHVSNAFLRHLFYGIGLAMFLIVPIVVATPKVWSWKDVSTLLPIRDDLTITHASYRNNDWLVSDGTNLYRFDGSLLTNLTTEARNHGLFGISDIVSDGQNWMVVYQPLDNSPTQVWLTDGQVWTDIAGKFPKATNGIDAAGSQGKWYVRIYQPASSGSPATFDLYTWQGGSASPVKVTMPQNVATLKAGCFYYQDRSKLCTGTNGVFFSNGQAFFVGGTSEASGAEGKITQQAASGIWKIVGDQFVSVDSVPAFKFMSGVWPSKETALIATSNAVANPFAADHFWVWNGEVLMDVTDQALTMRLLSKDTQNVRAVWSGRVWMILSGKRIARFDGLRMTSEGRTRDFFSTISSDEKGTILLGGALSDDADEIAIKPLNAKLVLAIEDLSKPLPANVAAQTDILSKTQGPIVTTVSAPTDAMIGNGKFFVFRASAQDEDGVERVDIYVQGARIKSCPGSICEYAQNYWINVEPKRSIKILARAVDRKGLANESEPVSLVIDSASQATASEKDITQPVVKETATKIAWASDALSGIQWSVGLSPNTTKLPAIGTVTYTVTASDADGLARADIWVDGAIRQTCTWKSPKDARSCSLTLRGSDYANPTEIFVNANIFDAKQKQVWTTGTLIQRLAASVKAATESVLPKGPIFTANATMDPNQIEISRGTTVTYRVKAQNNTSGLSRVEIYLNGKVQRTCNFGAMVSAVTCETFVDSGTYSMGTYLTFVGKAMDHNGNDVWSESKMAYVRGNENEQAKPVEQKSLSVWSWLAPAVSELNDLEQTTYSIGAWSTNGIKKIEMIVDGQVKNTCAWSQLGGSRECSVTLLPTQFSHGHVATVNARVTDGAGRIGWSDPRSILIKREWRPVPTTSPYVRIQAENIGGDPARLQLTTRGWSPNDVERIELFVDGVKVQSCPSESCVYERTIPTKFSIEYQAKLQDHLGQETWTGVMGWVRE